MARLWLHEICRVFSDRLVGEKDHETFSNLIGDKLGTLFDMSFHNLCPNKQLPVFGQSHAISSSLSVFIVPCCVHKSLLKEVLVLLFYLLLLFINR